MEPLQEAMWWVMVWQRVVSCALYMTPYPRFHPLLTTSCILSPPPSVSPPSMRQGITQYGGRGSIMQATPLHLTPFSGLFHPLLTTFRTPPPPFSSACQGITLYGGRGSIIQATPLYSSLASGPWRCLPRVV